MGLWWVVVVGSRRFSDAITSRRTVRRRREDGRGAVAGTYKISDDPQEVFERLAPLAKSKLVIDNEFVADLEPELWDGDEVTADIGAAGKRMQELITKH